MRGGELSAEALVARYCTLLYARTGSYEEAARRLVQEGYLLEEDLDHRVDARGFLRARLMDVFLGDYDRHEGQWRWARYDDANGVRVHPAALVDGETQRGSAAEPPGPRVAGLSAGCGAATV